MRGIKLNFFGNCFNFNSYPPHGQFGCCQNRTTRLFDALSIMTSLGSASYSTGLAIGSLFGGKHSTTSTSANKNQLPGSLSQYYAMQNPMFYGGMNGFMPTGMVNYPYLCMPMPQVDLFNPTSSYTDLFNETFTPEKTEGKTDIKNVNYDKNGKKLTPFQAFEKMNDVAGDLGYEKSKTHKKEEHGVDMVNQQWRDDANAKKENTEEDYKKLVKDFGKELIKGIDKKFGDNDGVLTYKEYEKYQLDDLPADADYETKQEMKKSIKISFNRLNINGGDTIDEKEITTLLSAMDFDKNGNVNGRITVNDFTRVSQYLIEDDKNGLDEVLKDRYQAFFEENE